MDGMKIAGPRVIFVGRERDFGGWHGKTACRLVVAALCRSFLSSLLVGRGDERSSAWSRQDDGSQGKDPFTWFVSSCGRHTEGRSFSSLLAVPRSMERRAILRLAFAKMLGARKKALLLGSFRLVDAKRRSVVFVVTCGPSLEGETSDPPLGRHRMMGARKKALLLGSFRLVDAKRRVDRFRRPCRP